MKTTTSTTACIAATPSMNARTLAVQEPEEMLYLRDGITPETIAMLMEYQDVLSVIVRCDEMNYGVQYTDIPSMDESLRHALVVALKATRLACNAAKGRWALRKVLRVQNKATA